MGAREPRMRVLCVLSSSNQMYSGIGRNVFELADRLADRVAFEFAVDDLVAQNRDLVLKFGAARGMPVHVGRGVAVADALDIRNRDLAAAVGSARWDLVECLCWANAATNDDLLGLIGDLPLAYTPHHQPTWTVPMSPAQAARTEAVHDRTIRRADVVFCDSPWERGELQPRDPHRSHCRYVALGCDFDAFRPGPLDRPERLLFVGDLAEPRKRFDRALELLRRLRVRRPGLRLLVVGNRSAEARGLIPAGLGDAVDLAGYVDEARLRSLYGECLGLVLLSEFEAFGIPILEALACGTPVFLTDHGPTRSLFGEFRGAHFCAAEDADATFAEVERTLDSGRIAVAEVLAQRPRLRQVFGWERLADQKWRHLAAAWSARRGWALSA